MHNKTTHLVCRRIMDCFGAAKYQKALQWGVHIVSFDWIIDSVRAGRFLPEPEYKTDRLEALCITPSPLPIKQYRRQHQMQQYSSNGMDAAETHKQELQQQDALPQELSKPVQTASTAATQLQNAQATNPSAGQSLVRSDSQQEIELSVSTDHACGDTHVASMPEGRAADNRPTTSEFTFSSAGGSAQPASPQWHCAATHKQQCASPDHTDAMHGTGAGTAAHGKNPAAAASISEQDAPAPLDLSPAHTGLSVVRSHCMSHSSAARNTLMHALDQPSASHTEAGFGSDAAFEIPETQADDWNTYDRASTPRSLVQYLRGGDVSQFSGISRASECAGSAVLDRSVSNSVGPTTSLDSRVHAPSQKEVISEEQQPSNCMLHTRSENAAAAVAASRDHTTQLVRLQRRAGMTNKHVPSQDISVSSDPELQDSRVEDEVTSEQACGSEQVGYYSISGGKAHSCSGSSLPDDDSTADGLHRTRLSFSCDVQHSSAETSSCTVSRQMQLSTCRHKQHAGPQVTAPRANVTDKHGVHHRHAAPVENDCTDDKEYLSRSLVSDHNLQQASRQRPAGQKLLVTAAASSDSTSLPASFVTRRRQAAHAARNSLESVGIAIKEEPIDAPVDSHSNLGHHASMAADRPPGNQQQPHQSRQHSAASGGPEPTLKRHTQKRQPQRLAEQVRMKVEYNEEESAILFAHDMTEDADVTRALAQHMPIDPADSTYSIGSPRLDEVLQQTIQDNHRALVKQQQGHKARAATEGSTASGAKQAVHTPEEHLQQANSHNAWQQGHQIDGRSYLVELGTTVQYHEIRAHPCVQNASPEAKYCQDVITSNMMCHVLQVCSTTPTVMMTLPSQTYPAGEWIKVQRSCGVIWALTWHI